MSSGPNANSFRNFTKGQFYKRWLSDRAVLQQAADTVLPSSPPHSVLMHAVLLHCLLQTYPLFIIMGCALALVSFAGSRTLFAHPDV